MSTGNPMGDYIRHVIDTISVGAVVGVILGLLPAIAALGAAVWYLIQIWESRTCQHWIANRRMKYRARKIARLKAKQKVLEAKLQAAGVLKEARYVARDKVETATAEAAVDKVVAEAELAHRLPPV